MFVNILGNAQSMINTHAIVKSLIATGFTEVQAEAITNAVTSGQHNLEEFVTKEQYAFIEKELGDIKAQITELRNETREQIAETREQIVQLRNETREQIAETREQIVQLRNETREQIAETREQIVQLRNETREQIAETREQIVQLRNETREQIAETKNDIMGYIKENLATKAEISDLKAEMFKFMMPFFVSIIGLMFALIGIGVALFFRG